MNSKMFVDDTPGITLAEMRAKARRLKPARRRGLDLIVIDYLQLMTGSTQRMRARRSFENRNAGGEFAISRGLKALAKELNMCPCWH